MFRGLVLRYMETICSLLFLLHYHPHLTRNLKTILLLEVFPNPQVFSQDDLLSLVEDGLCE